MSKRRSAFVIACAAVTIFIILLSLVGGQDYQDAKRDEAQYCSDIAAGVYPDYRELRKECERVKTSGQ